MGQIVLSSQVFHQRRTLGGTVQHLNDCDDQKQSDNESSAWWLRRHDATATDTHNTILIFSRLSTSRMLYYIILVVVELVTKLLNAETAATRS